MGIYWLTCTCTHVYCAIIGEKLICLNYKWSRNLDSTTCIQHWLVGLKLESYTYFLCILQAFSWQCSHLARGYDSMCLIFTGCILPSSVFIAVKGSKVNPMKMKINLNKKPLKNSAIECKLNSSTFWECKPFSIYIKGTLSLRSEETFNRTWNQCPSLRWTQTQWLRITGFCMLQ